MTDETGMNDPESDLDNAALADVLRALLHSAPPAPVDAAWRAAQVRAAIERAWPHGMPPAAEPGHHQGGRDAHDAPADAAHASTAPGAPRLDHLHETGQHHPPGPLDPGLQADPRRGQPGGPGQHGDPGQHGPFGDPHGGH